MTDEFGAFNPFSEEEENTVEEDSAVSEVNSKETHKQAVEHKDKERLGEIEDQYKELDEDLLDIEDDEDTMWMIQRVGFGILKIIGVLAILVFIFWSIWGGSSKNSKTTKNSTDKKIEKIEKPKNLETKKKNTANPAKKDSPKKESSGFWSNLFSKNDSQEKEQKETTNKKTEIVIPSVSKEEVRELETETKKSSPHMAMVQIIAWNYWLEKDRLLGKKNTPGEVALWTKDAEALFDVPFGEQIKGNNDLEREKRVNSLTENTSLLLKKAENIQNKLLAEIAEFSDKEQKKTNEATEYERLFLQAMNTSDPTGIDEFLAKKIAAEKGQIANGIEAESRRILSQKVDSYAQVLKNLHEYLLANKKALVKDVQVVDFPEDPFNRIVPLETWESLKHPAN